MTSEWPLILHGDAEGACIDILQSATEMQAFDSLTISSSLNGYLRGKKWIEVIREGGALQWPYKGDKPRIDFNVHAGSRTDALQIALVSQAVLLRAMGDYVGNGLRLIDVKIETGVFRVPDKPTDSPRYAFSLRLTCVPSS